MKTEIPLSQKGVDKTLRSLKRLRKQLTSSYEGTLPELEETAANSLLETLNGHISAISHPDGNFADPMDVSVRSVPGFGTRLIWSGNQVAFLEFGTGAVAIETGGYDLPDVHLSAGYEHQRLHGELAPSEWWGYKDRSTGESARTRGIPAYAPMYKTAMDAPGVFASDSFRRHAKEAVDHAIETAFGGR